MAGQSGKRDRKRPSETGKEVKPVKAVVDDKVERTGWQGAGLVCQGFQTAFTVSAGGMLYNLPSEGKYTNRKQEHEQ